MAKLPKRYPPLQAACVSAARDGAAMLVPMHAFALLAALTLQIPATAGAEGAAAPKAPAATGVAAHGPGANPGRSSRAALREVAEAQMLSELVPPPLTATEVRALAAALGAGAESTSAIDSIVSLYEVATHDAYARTSTAVRARLGSAYDAGGTSGALAPAAGPELVAVLQLSAAWRDTLAAADGEMLRRMGVLRTSVASISPALQAFNRIRDRDDLPAADPAAAIRLPDLLTEAGMKAEDRMRIENQLDRHWVRLATAIGNRRRELGQLELERARMLADWGPAWEISAAPALAADRTRALELLAARQRSTELELGNANREAFAALLRQLPPESAALIRSTVDEMLWPWLFAAERQLDAAVARARAVADPALAEPLDALSLDLKRRLEGSRRELSKRAGRAGELDQMIADAQLGTPPEQVLGALESQLALLDLLAKRREIIRAFALQMKQSSGSDARVVAIFDERVAAIDADARTAEWRRRGLQARIAEIGEGAHLAPPPPAAEGEAMPGGTP